MAAGSLSWVAANFDFGDKTSIPERFGDDVAPAAGDDVAAASGEELILCACKNNGDVTPM